MNAMLRYSVCTRFLACLVVCSACVALGGCGELIYLFTGRDHVSPQFEIPKKSRVLVFADRRPGRDVPLEIPDLLDDALNVHLYQFKAADNFVAPARLAEMRKDPLFSEMSIPDVARKVEADIVIYIDVLNFQVKEQSDGQVNSGVAEVAVKVVDRDGKRLWPEDSTASPLGQSVTAEIEEMMSDSRPVGKTRTEMLHRLTIRVGRLFHEWDAQDRTINK